MLGYWDLEVLGGARSSRNYSRGYKKGVLVTIGSGSTYSSPTAQVEAATTHVEIRTSKVLLYHRNLDACAPPAPRDPAPLLLSLAQARLNFGFGPAHPAHPTDRTVAEPKSRVPQITRGNLENKHKASFSETLRRGLWEWNRFPKRLGCPRVSMFHAQDRGVKASSPCKLICILSKKHKASRKMLMYIQDKSNTVITLSTLQIWHWRGSRTCPYILDSFGVTMRAKRLLKS
jgi:hypothetical protein